MYYSLRVVCAFAYLRCNRPKSRFERLQINLDPDGCREREIRETERALLNNLKNSKHFSVVRAGSAEVGSYLEVMLVSSIAGWK